MVSSSSDLVIPDVDNFSRPSTRWSDLEKEGQLLYTAYILPDKSETRAKYGTTLAEKIAYRILDGGETWIVAGKPVFISLDKFLQAADITPSAEIVAQKDEYIFGYLKLACGFGGHRGSPHPMISGSMTVTLDCDIGDPMVYEWLPKDTLDEQSVEKEYSISSSLKFLPFNIGAGYKKHVEFTQLKPRTIAIGGQTGRITWKYHVTPSIKQIEGGRDARVIVRMPRRAKALRVTVDVQATVKESFLERVFPTSRKWKQEDFQGLSEEEFTLSRAIGITYDDLHRKRFQRDFADNLLSKPDLSHEAKTMLLRAH